MVRDPGRHGSGAVHARFVQAGALAGRIFLDVLRNRRGAVTVAPYSTRARDNAPVSTPVDWDELPTLTGADHFTVANLRRRLTGLTRDPWEGLADCRQTITAGTRRAVGAN